MQNNVDKVDYHCNPNRARTPWYSDPREQTYTTNSSNQSVGQQQSSFYDDSQVKTRRPTTSGWQQSEQTNTRHLPTKQQHTKPSSSSQDNDKKDEPKFPVDNDDYIMEKDLENILKELEQEDKKRQNLLTQLRKEQLKHDKCSFESTKPGFQRTYMEEIEYTEVYKQFKPTEQEKQYSLQLKELDERERQLIAELDSLKEFDKDKQDPSDKIPWYKANPLQPRRHQEEQRLLLAKKQKYELQMKLQWIKEKQTKIKQVIDLEESNSKTKKTYVTIRKSYYKKDVIHS